MIHDTQCLQALDLLSAPSGILSLTHVAWGFDRRDELEGDVANTNDTDNATRNLAHNSIAKKHTAEEDIDLANGQWQVEVEYEEYLQKPRPIKEKRKEAYRETWGGI